MSEASSLPEGDDSHSEFETHDSLDESAESARDRSSEMLEEVDDFGQLLESNTERAGADIEDRRWGELPEERESPDDDYESFAQYVSGTSDEIEDLDRKISLIESLKEDAQEEAEEALLGLVDGEAPHRAQESSQDTLDYFRESGKQTIEDEEIQEILERSANKNVDRYEERITDLADELKQELAEYEEEFTTWMRDMVDFMETQYAAMEQMADHYAELLETEFDSDHVASDVRDVFASEVREALVSQTRKISEAYNEMEAAYEGLQEMTGELPEGIDEVYDRDFGVEDTLERADQIMDNMADGYDSFRRRAEAMLAEAVPESENRDYTVMEGWGDYSQSRA